MPNSEEKKEPKKILRPPMPKVSIAKMGGKNSWRGFLIYAVLGFILFTFLIFTSNPVERLSPQEPLSKVIVDIRDSRVDSVEIDGERLSVKLRDGQIYTSRKEENQSFFETLRASNVDGTSAKITVRDRTFSQAWVTILTTVLPLGLMVLFFFFIFRQAREGASSVFSFGQSRARQFTQDMPKVTFDDVAGVDEAKQELQEVVDFLKHPEKYKAVGARTPKGVLLVGPAGTGKTLLAKSLAGEAGVPFFSVAGSEFMEMLVGVGASRVRDLFSQAKRIAPSIIFIDEIESIGRMRGLGFSGGHDEREQTLNQILVEMDGFSPNDNVLVTAASVTGDTPIIVREYSESRLLPIGEFVDRYYGFGEEGIEKEVANVETLGFERKVFSRVGDRLYFQNSAFKEVGSVFRHRVSEIYEIEYLGGKIRTTGNHAVFVRTGTGIVAKPVSQLSPGEILVNLPCKVNRGNKDKEELRAHQFNKDFSLSLSVLVSSDEEDQLGRGYVFAIENHGVLSQTQIAASIGVAQSTIGNWQRGLFYPRAISPKYFNHELPEKIKVTPDLCRLFGYYAAEGYGRKGVDFCFNKDEVSIFGDLKRLMEQIFGLRPDKELVRGQAINIIYYSRPLGDFFVRHCGRGAHFKHVPPFLFEAPKEYFLEFLKGVFLGDGYEDKRGRGEITSVSKQFILELNWLCRMHGLKSYVGGFVGKEGRRIRDGKPLAAVEAFRLGFGKTNNPFTTLKSLKNNPLKRPIVRSVKKVPYEGFVYDLCGVENEAFFGGESPILLHNTNRPDLLDPALTRPGRFDRRVVLDLPDIEGRKAIIKIHMKGKPFAREVDIESMAKRTVGFSGADLANMLNEAAILAARGSRKEINNIDVEEAATKVKLGPQRKRMQSVEERKMTAYHESGHAMVAHYLPNVDPVHRISIVARGMTGGHTLVPPQVDRYTETKTRLLERMATLLGGRAAEDLIFGEFTTGAASDLEIASTLAREMVTEFGMSELGPTIFAPRPQFGVWPTMAEPSQVSPELAAKIDREIAKFIDAGYKRARAVLAKHRAKLDLVASTLLEKETLERDEFEKLVGKPVGDGETKFKRARPAFAKATGGKPAKAAQA